MICPLLVRQVLLFFIILLAGTDLLVKNYEVFQQNYKDYTTRTIPKRRKLASRNIGFAVGRAEWYISEHEGCKLLLDDYLATKSYGREETYPTIAGQSPELYSLIH
ncbi:hypothetical protein SAMN05661099_1974 [Daejeonella lutea]|uniref:Uncharacterized protein n=2 Tax=Daejeonella lutea TaxID=572036 RepID=A0A1T5CX52_9SPHI|nr:hypothetical protein SAMN05661099_1974 [Daejeonella lutea]